MILKSKAEAESRGRAVLDSLPRGWSLEVWNKGGWSFRLVNGPVVLYQKTGGEFQAVIADAGDPPGFPGPWTLPSDTSADPLEAVARARATCVKWIEDRVQQLDGVLDSLTPVEALSPASVLRGRLARSCS